MVVQQKDDHHQCCLPIHSENQALTQSTVQTDQWHWLHLLTTAHKRKCKISNAPICVVSFCLVQDKIYPKMLKNWMTTIKPFMLAVSYIMSDMDVRDVFAAA